MLNKHKNSSKRAMKAEVTILDSSYNVDEEDNNFILTLGNLALLKTLILQPQDLPSLRMMKIKTK